MVHVTRNDGLSAITATQIFTAIFPLIYGAFQLAQAMSSLPDIAAGSVAAEKIYKLIQYPSSICMADSFNDKSKVALPDSAPALIEFKDVWFRYPTRKEGFVLKGLSMTVQPGDSVALVGESGCGKSTIVNLLMRFYDPDSGQILLNGIDIKDYNLLSLR